MPTPTLFQLDASLPFAAKVNPIIASSQRLPFGALMREIILSYGDAQSGDQLKGLMTPGCATLAYNDTTELQTLILAWYEHESEGGAGQGQLPEDLQDILEANAGPKAPWNFSYHQWGVVPGVAGELKPTLVFEVGTAKAIMALIPNL